MRKFVLCGIVAVSLAMTTGQEAKAWVNWKFGVGLGWQWQSGGNNLLWGLARGAQVPGPEFYGFPGGGFDGGFGDHHGGFHYDGGHHGGHASAMPYAAPVIASPLPAGPASSDAPSLTVSPAQTTYWYGANPYHTVGFGAYPSATYYPSYYTAPYYYGR